jgi:hypothetical protein
VSGAGIMTARTPIIEIQEVDSCKELLAIEGLSKHAHAARRSDARASRNYNISLLRQVLNNCLKRGETTSGVEALQVKESVSVCTSLVS